MKRLLMTTATLAAAGLLVAGCSDPGAGGGTADTGDITWPEATASLEGVELTLWAAQASNAIPEGVVAAFEDATGAKVEIVTIPDPYENGIQTKVATGDKPDLAFWQPTSSMLTAINAANNLQVLDDAPWIEDMDPDLQDLTGILNDTRYAALISSPSVQGVYYNKQVFADAGITELPTSFEDMVAKARTIKETTGVTPFFEQASAGWSTQWWPQVLLADAAADGYWDKVNANEASLADDVMVDAIQTLKDLIDEGLFNSDIVTATFEDQGDALLNGKAAMAVQINALFGQLQAKADTATLNETIGYFPISPSGNVATSHPDQSNAIVAFKTGDAQREAAARQFLTFWMTEYYPTFIEEQNTVSLMTGVESPSSVPQALLDVHASLSDSVGSMQAQAVANPDLWMNVVDVINNVKTPKQAAEATQQQFVELAKASGIDGF
ncbi:ABC transporter substrate-binding protein [Cellulomonas cellasea]|uniref:ABC transporter substrate-binding protein n=1 Tax=Cellulomonas cellasea TaxID=43670 RepID=UPI0025A49EDF|nr:ABC transporter substrate-binding protein [Cellulomonas cellasea]MDM8085566.1 ABC transporter substrate-binding protein [Cellulomonas cellasea]